MDSGRPTRSGRFRGSGRVPLAPRDVVPPGALAALTAAALLWLWPAEPAEAKIAMRVSSVAITSSPSSGTTYEKGETISVTVTFNQAVTVSGTPRLRLQIECNKDGTSKTCTRRAKYASGPAPPLSSSPTRSRDTTRTPAASHQEEFNQAEGLRRHLQEWHHREGEAGPRRGTRLHQPQGGRQFELRVASTP